MRRLLVLCTFWFTACTFSNEPIAVTRVEATAVPPVASSPTAPPSPTATPASPTWTVTAVTSTSVPAANQDIPQLADLLTPTPTPLPPATLSEFLVTLQDNLNARDFDTLKEMMPARFVLGTQPNQRDNPAAAHAVEFLAYRYVPSIRPEIVISEENILPDLPALYAVEAIFKAGENIAAVVPSSGWGEGGQGEMILYIALEDGKYRWAGLLATPAYYAVPELETIAPPAGLIYRQGNDLWRVDQSGESEFMTTFSGTLSFNPSGTLALYAANEDHQLTLLHLPEGVTETIPIDGTLLHGSWHMPWVDEETAVLIIGAPDEDVTQSSVGNLAVLNVLNGTVTTYPPALSVYSQPSVGNGDILYNGQEGLRLWHDGGEHTVNFAHTLTFAGTESEVTSLYAPVMSPDGRYMVGVYGGEYGRYTWAYILTDLTAQTSVFTHFFLPVPTDAVMPWGIHWSPNSQWVALDPPSWALFENSIQLISVTNPSDKISLTGITRQPFWLNDWQLVFKSFVEDQSRWRYMDLQTGEQFWLDLPDGVEVVHYVPSN